MYEIRFAGRCDPNPGGVMNCAFIIYERKALGRNPDREIGRGCQVFPAAERNTVNVAAWYALGFALKWLKDRRLKGNVVAMTHRLCQTNSTVLIVRTTLRDCWAVVKS